MLTKYFQTKRALGSDVTLVVVSEYSEPVANKLFDILWGVIFRFERQFSRFIPESELSIFNRLGGNKQSISPEFHALLRASERMSMLTAGLYNPFILPALQRAGYTRSFLPGHEADSQPDYSRRLVFSADKLELGEDWAKIPYGAAIDMGGCGKGYLADLLSQYVPDGVVGYWFSLGGDIVARGMDSDLNFWSVDIENAGQMDSTLATSFTTGSDEIFAVASSGTTKRTGKRGGHAWHHIIDPRTQKPSTSDIRLASVCTSSALEADVLASCAVILGSREAVPFLKSKGVSSAVLQTLDGQQIAFGKQLRIKEKARA